MSEDINNIYVHSNKIKVMFNVRIDDDVIEVVTHRIAILDM